MERNFAGVAVAVFTLLFAVSTARISLDPRPADVPLRWTMCGSNSLTESAAETSNLAIRPSDTKRSKPDGADQVQKADNDRMFRVDLTPRSDFARFHAINRRFFDEHRPYRHNQNPFVIPKSENSHRNKVISTDETGKFDAHNFHHHGASSRFMKFKHDDGHQHRHQHHHHLHIHHNMKDASMPKHKFVQAKSLVHQHKEKTREHEASFMKSIRKFLKHTFD